MSNIEIDNNTGEVLGWKKTRAFETNSENRTIYFWASEYSWEELLKIADSIRVLQIEVEAHKNKKEK